MSPFRHLVSVLIFMHAVGASLYTGLVGGTWWVFWSTLVLLQVYVIQGLYDVVQDGDSGDDSGLW